MNELNFPLIDVYKDTSCINARNKDIHLNELEYLHRRRKINISVTDMLDRELRKDKGYPAGIKKSTEYVYSCGPAVVGQSKVGDSIVGSIQDQERLTDILSILFGKRNRVDYTVNQLRDARHVNTAVYYQGQFFVTLDTGILSGATQIESKHNLKIRNPEDCLNEIKILLIE